MRAKLSKLIVGFCALVFFAGDATAQERFPEPKANVSGVDGSVPRDDLVVVNVVPEQLKYLEGVDYKWLVLADDKPKKNVLDYPGNTRIAFVVGKAKKVQVLLVATNKYVVREKDDPKGAILEFQVRTSYQFFNLKIDGDPEPHNPPTPNPNPTPVPVPDSKFGLTKIAYNSVNQVTDSNTRVKGAKALSVSYAGVASSIRAGAIKDYTEAFKTALSVSNAALKNNGVEPSTWNAWGNSLQTALYKLYQENKLTSVTDLAVAFDEVAGGLSLVK